MGSGDAIGIVLASLALCIGVFIVCREIMLWYWKVNRIVELLESIDSKLDGLDTLGRK